MQILSTKQDIQAHRYGEYYTFTTGNCRVSLLGMDKKDAINRFMRQFKSRDDMPKFTVERSR